VLPAIRSTFAALLVVLSLAGCSAGSGPSAPAPSASPARIELPAHPTAYFFGDSWTQGYSAAAGRGYVFVASKALGWRAVLGPDGSGTGYTRVNSPGAPTYPQRAAQLPTHVSADVVVLQGSINDELGNLSKLDPAVDRTVALLRQKTGDAPIIMLGPAPASTPVSYELYQIDAQLSADAERLHIPYISPIRGKWIDAKNVAEVIDAGTGHPGTSGHAYFGSKVAGAIRALVQERATAR
jgi:lysophospholipase L1-like esterase